MIPVGPVIMPLTEAQVDDLCKDMEKACKESSNVCVVLLVVGLE